MKRYINLSIRFKDDKLINKILEVEKISLFFLSDAVYNRDYDGIKKLLEIFSLGQGDELNRIDKVIPYDKGMIVCDFKQDIIIDAQNYINVGKEFYCLTSESRLYLSNAYAKNRIIEVYNNWLHQTVDPSCIGELFDSIPNIFQNYNIYYETGCVIYNVVTFRRKLFYILRKIGYPVNLRDFLAFVKLENITE